MPYLTAAPGVIASAATDLAGIGSNLSAAHAVAAAQTLAVLPAAADEVSVTIANFFSRHAQHYQAQAGQAAAAQEQFVQQLANGAGLYAAAEAANAAMLPPAESITGAISALWGDVQNFFAGALTTFEQMLNQLAGFLLPLIREAIAFSTAFFFVFVLPTIEIALNILVAL
ncbi:PE family protein [Mycobacterium sp. IEC1808]|uniref:PE family protein n=1 Tax=Mycobacterium sp. IEC1808 TaxID=1743230 RepID=UPI000A14AB22|nr:PE family protein [Mycobacterium sp. IEC1808]